jgi:hypothetical protein
LNIWEVSRVKYQVSRTLAGAQLKLQLIFSRLVSNRMPGMGLLKDRRMEGSLGMSCLLLGQAGVQPGVSKAWDLGHELHFMWLGAISQGV